MMYQMLCRDACNCEKHKPIVFEFKDQWPLTEFFQSELEKIMITLKRVYKATNDKELKNIIDDFEHKINLHKEWGQWK